MMAGKVRTHLRGNVVGYIAVFIALSGSSYAAVALEKNQVKSKHIGDGQVKNPDIANGAVTSPTVANGSLLDEDFAAGELPAGPQGLPGAAGREGPPGPTGPEGPRGPSGSPDTGAQILGKLAPVDGGGSGLDADAVDGLNGASFVQRQGASSIVVAGTLVTSQAFASGNSSTFIDLGNFELRSVGAPNFAGSGFQLCNMAGIQAQVAFLYTGGAIASTAETREVRTVTQGTCQSVDYNGSQTDAQGDFRLHIPVDDATIFGAGFGTATNGSVSITGIRF